MKFSAERLRDARHYRKTTSEELASMIGVNKQSISQFENEKCNPDPSTLGEIAKVLEFPISFFIEPPKEVLIGNTYFRALFSSKQKDLAAQRVRAKYLAQIHDVLSEKISFKPLNLPPYAYDMALSIEDYAAYVREYWELGERPIENMVQVLEQNGLIVGEFSTNGDEIDAFYQYCEVDKQPMHTIVLGTDKSSFYRRQFNCAHELAHVLLHERYKDFDEMTREEFRKREEQANAFAAALLMPKKTFSSDFANYGNRLNYYSQMKEKWRVSMSAMMMRTRSLGLISENQYLYLMRTMSARGYRKVEPLDSETPLRHPKAHSQAIKLLIDKKGYTCRDILALFSERRLSLSRMVLEELLNLEPALLDANADGSIIVQFPTSP